MNGEYIDRKYGGVLFDWYTYYIHNAYPSNRIWQNVSAYHVFHLLL